MNEKELGKLEAASQASEKDRAVKEERPPRPDKDSVRSDEEHRQYDSFMRIIRR